MAKKLCKFILYLWLKFDIIDFILLIIRGGVVWKTVFVLTSFPNIYKII